MSRRPSEVPGVYLVYIATVWLLGGFIMMMDRHRYPGMFLTYAYLLGGLGVSMLWDIPLSRAWRCLVGWLPAVLSRRVMDWIMGNNTK